MNPLIRGIKTIRQVGLLPVLQVALYRFGLLTGHYRRVSDSQAQKTSEKKIAWLEPGQSLGLSVVSRFLNEHSELSTECLRDAEMILDGKCRIFGHQVVDIFEDGLDVSHHWTDYANGQVPLQVEDIKFIWEPARLGWVYALARAATLKKIPNLAGQSWYLIEKFLKSNPVNYGPNWSNGQEVAIRILALVFFHEVFREETDMPNGWEQALAKAVIEHARRIPPTLVYAQSQHNNHLLVEAASLYTAGIFLTNHPEARKWRDTGWQVFHKALDDQIQDDGTYGQFSTNYHRLMLQIAVWMKAVSLRVGDEFPDRSQQKLAAAINWLRNLVDAETGLIPNYGHNDGAYIFPLTGSSFHDFRPVITAAGHFFQQELDSINSDEMTLWFEWLSGGQISAETDLQPTQRVESYRKLTKGKSCVVMFAPLYKSRPGQADVLQTDIWWNGNPITLDAGTYLYNGKAPWTNTLGHTKFHNTVTIFQQDQMQYAGRFLWLDWPQVKWVDRNNSADSISAEHDGYKHFGVVHNRQIELVGENCMNVIDSVYPTRKLNRSTMDVWLHWLLPDSEWTITTTGVQGVINHEKITINISLLNDAELQPAAIQLITAGVLVGGKTNPETPANELVNFGWVSPTYAKKIPAYSYRVMLRGNPPIKFHTQFQFG